LKLWAEKITIGMGIHEGNGHFLL